MDIVEQKETTMDLVKSLVGKKISCILKNNFIEKGKIIKEKYPDHKPIFIGPCEMKKLEASEDIPELGILVLTYRELQDVFNHFGITDQNNPDDKFDISETGKTMMYPLDGGLSHSSGLTEQMESTDQVRIVSGGKNIPAIKEFDTNPKIKLLDILNCPGGCRSGRRT